MAGPPGAGKDHPHPALAFITLRPSGRVLYFSTLSEPTAKTLRYLRQFSLLRRRRSWTAASRFVDLGEMLRTQGLAQAHSAHHGAREAVKPAIVVIDSFKVFDDLAESREELRKFGYELAVNLWPGRHAPSAASTDPRAATNPFFSIVDGADHAHPARGVGRAAAVPQIVKMRGTAHHRDEHPFVITPTASRSSRPA